MGKKSKVTQKVTLDPQTQELNSMRLAQERLYAPYRARGAELVGNVFDPSFQLPAGSVRSPYRLLDGTMLPGVSMEELSSRIPGLAEMRFSNREEALAASRLAALTDVSGLQSAARQHIDKIVAPQLLSAAIAQGMGRGGAGLEAIANAAGQFALPIEQARIAGENNLANWFTGRGDLRTQLATGVSDPARMSFMSAPTTTQTTKGGGNMLGSILGAVGTVVGGIYGGPAGAVAGGTLGSTLGGGGGGGKSGGGSSGLPTSWSLGGGGKSGGGTNWNIPQMASAYRL